MTAVGTEVNVESVAGGAVGDSSWAPLVGDEDVFQSCAWQAVVRRTAGTTLARFTARGAGGARAGIAAAMAMESSPWLLGRADTVLAASAAAGLEGATELAAALAGRPLLPGIVAGGRHLGRTRVVGPAATDPEVVDALVARVEAAAADARALSVCFPHVDRRDAVLWDVLALRGYRSHHSADYCWLDVPVGGREEYLAGLSQRRRRHVRTARRALDEAGVEVVVLPLADAPLDRLGALEAELQHKYGNPADAVTSARLLRAVVEEVGDDALVSCALLDNDVIGFGLVLTRGAHWFGHRAGFDYARQGQLPLYEEVLYLRVLDEAARAGATTLHAGIGSVNAKRALRCAESPQFSHVLVLGDRL